MKRTILFSCTGLLSHPANSSIEFGLKVGNKFSNQKANVLPQAF